MHVPLKVGPTKNIYQFTQLRDHYKNKFIETAQKMTDLEAKVANLERSKLGVPKITGAYASLINSDLHDDLNVGRSESFIADNKVTSALQ